MFYRFLLILLVLIPTLDLWSLKLLGDGYVVLGLTIGIAVGGGTAAWFQWRKLWKRYQEQFSPAAMPPDMTLHAVLIFAAAIMTVTPGFFSGMIAVFLLLPPVRVLIVFLIFQQHLLFQAARFQKKYRQQWAQNHPSASPADSAAGREDDIDVDFHKK
ncbi:MAG: FxsA family protein [Planctomycetaceae bacterium]|nr:FxsA family protein [Planctomycetaceae bacterium]